MLVAVSHRGGYITTLFLISLLGCSSLNGIKLSFALRIFLSGKEDDVDDERAMARVVIEEFKLYPVDSQGRPASNQPMRDRNLEEVRNSDIYVGIFSMKHSEPSIEEFVEARAQRIPTLVFVKQDKNIGREEKLDEFLDGIKNRYTGVVLSYYDNVIDFKMKLVEALADLLSHEFHEGRKCKAAMELKKAEIQAESPQSTSMPAFIKIEIPEKVELGKTHNVSTTVTGPIANAFLDLKIVNPDGREKYYPDPKSWDAQQDYGRLVLDPGKSYQAEWNFTVSDRYNKPGKYKVFLQIYEDSGERPNKQRKLVLSQEKDIEVT